MIKTFPLKRNFLATRSKKNLFSRKEFLSEKKSPDFAEIPGATKPFSGFPKTESSTRGRGGARRGRKKSAEIRSSRGPRRGAWGHEGRGAPAHAAAPDKLARGSGPSSQTWRPESAQVGGKVVTRNFLRPRKLACERAGARSAP